MKLLIKWINSLLFLSKKFKDWLKDTHNLKHIVKYSNQITECKNQEN